MAMLDHTQLPYLTDSPSGGGALNGIRILDITSVIMGPYATQILGDHGAEVIFVEHPSGVGTRELGAPTYTEFSGISLNLLRNKKSLSIDLKEPGARDALLAVARDCDVVVTNLRSAPLGRLRLRYEDFKAINPEIIFCQAVGFSGDTVRTDDPAYDDIIQAECGLADAYARVTGTPQLCPTILADKVCGLFIANAVFGAVLHRLRTGRGQAIEVPMVDVMRAFLMVEHGAGAVADPQAGHAGYQRVLNPQRGPQKTKDGWIMILPYSADAYDAIFRVGGRSDLVGDQRTRGRGTMNNAEYLYAQLRPIIAERTTEEWITFCQSEGIPVGRVEDLDDVLRGYPLMTHPVFGPYRSVPFPVRYSDMHRDFYDPAPMLGEHTSSLLRRAGMDEAVLSDLIAKGVVRGARLAAIEASEKFDEQSAR